jgi:hypothetical protein
MSPLQEDRPQSGPPLWSIGLVVALMLVVPMVLYSIAPPSPIRKGDTIFSDGALKVSLAHPLLYESAHLDGTCLLDPHDPLMALQQPSDRPDGLILAKVQDKTAMEWPFCPPQAEVLLGLHHSMQKTAVFSGAQSRLMEWWKR